MAIFVALTHPEWSMSCEDCRKYLHEDGRPMRHKLSKKWIERPATCPPPCRACPKIPDSAPEKHWRYAADLDATASAVYRYYRECRAVKDFPNDELVRACAVMIADGIEDADRRERRAADDRLETLFRLIVTPRRT